MACGSSRILVDLMAGRTPALDVTPFRVRTHRVAA
jgi:glycine/D-amino acid oxidase-like deaminating enzyme